MFTLSRFQRLEIQNQAVGRAGSSGGCEGETTPGSPSFRWLLAVLSVPGLVDTALQYLPLSSHHLCVSFCVSFEDTVIGCRALPNPGWWHLNPYLVISAKTLFQRWPAVFYDAGWT